MSLEISNARILDYIAYPIELVASCIGLLSLLLLLFICNRVREFHTNLRFLLTVLMIFYCLFVIPRMVIIPTKLLKEMNPANGTQYSDVYSMSITVLYLMHDYALWGFMATSLLISLERLAATLLVSSYERMYQHVIIRLSVPPFMVLFVVITLYVQGTSVTNATWWFPMSVCICIATLLVHICCYLLNRYKSRDATLSLGEKYQMNENVRALRILLPVAILSFSTQMIQWGILSYIFFVRDETTPYFTFRVFTHSFNVISALFAATAPWILMMSHPRYKLKCKKMFVRTKITDSPKNPRNETEMEDLKRSKKNLSEEAEIYFRDLKQQWS